MNAPRAPLSPSLPGRHTSDATMSMDDGVHAYRALFSCQYIGKLSAMSKRKIAWRFGLCTNAPDGSRHTFREEHQVELTWSIKSGKTELLWNNTNISHYFPWTKSSSNPPKVLRYSWQSSSGVTFKIEAHADLPEDGRHQYEFLIDGRSFFSLPSASEFLAMKRESQSYVRVTPEKHPSPDGSATCVATEKHTNPDGSATGKVAEDELEKLVLPQINTPKIQRHADSRGSGREEDTEDALHSDLYSSSLVALRGEISNSVPELEEMLSRAIIYAYSEDHDSLGSSIADSFSIQTGDELDPAQVEADALCEAYDWMTWTTLHETENDMKDLKLEFMRGYVEKMVMHARHERLPPLVAAKIMVSISAVLDLRLARRIQCDTVILVGMDPGVTTQIIYGALNPFGQIEAVCTATSENGFESDVSAACRAARENELRILGGRLEMYNVFAKEFSWCTKSKEPEPSRRRKVVSDLSVPGHRRRDLTISGQHWIDPRGEGGVEIYEVDDSGTHSMPSSTSQNPTNDNITQDFLEFSSSKVSSMSPTSLKEMSTDTTSTLCTTFDGEDYNLTGTSIFLKNIHNT